MTRTLKKSIIEYAVTNCETIWIMVTVVHASKKNFSVIVLTSQKVWILVWLQAQTFELGYFNLHTKIVII